MIVPAFSMVNFFTFGISGLVMIGVLVVIHEFGHFLFAKLFGVEVPVFSVGMGPRLFGFEYRGTDYRLSAFPVGGYVQMAGADPFGEEDVNSAVDPEADFMNKPIWQRLIVMLAGPVFNLILPFIVFTAVLMAGEPQPAPVIGMVLEGSPAEQMGFVAGDRILRLDDEPIVVFSEVFRHLREHADQVNHFVIERDGKQLEVVAPAGAVVLTDDGLVDSEQLGIFSNSRSTRVGVSFAESPMGVAGVRSGDILQSVDGQPIEAWQDMMTLLDRGPRHELRVLRVLRGEEPVELELRVDRNSWTPPADEVWTNPWGLVPIMIYIGRVSPDSASEDAGLKELDRLWSIDGHPVYSWNALHRLVGSSMDGRSQKEGPRPLDIVVMRDGVRIPITLTPRLTREVVMGKARFRPLMGVERHPDAYVSGPTAKKYYSFTEAVPMAGRQGKQVLDLTFGILYRLITRDLKPQEAVGGPVAIFQAAGESAQSGIHSFARTLGTISFSLGIINLLPIPLLDGGQIVFYAIEGLRGRPLSVRIRERIQIVAVLGLMALMLLVTVMDVNRWLTQFFG